MGEQELIVAIKTLLDGGLVAVAGLGTRAAAAGLQSWLAERRDERAAREKELDRQATERAREQDASRSERREEREERRAQIVAVTELVTELRRHNDLHDRLEARIEHWARTIAGQRRDDTGDDLPSDSPPARLRR